MEAKKINRVFVFKDGDREVKIDDPNPAFNISEVQDFLSDAYPEIVNSVISPPEEVDGVLKYTFTTSYGKKG